MCAKQPGVPHTVEEMNLVADVAGATTALLACRTSGVRESSYCGHMKNRPGSVQCDVGSKYTTIPPRDSLIATKS